MMRMSTLASWIDSEAVASMARELCQGDDEGTCEIESGVWDGGRGMRRQKVAVAGYPREEEVSQARLKLETIRAQARHSGLIDHAVKVVNEEEPGRMVRMGDDEEPVEGGGKAEPPATMGEAIAENESGDGPFQEKRRVVAQPVERKPVTGASTEAEAYVIPSGTLGVRMASFADWVSQVTGGADVFVIDGQGYPLVERGGDSDLMAAALLLGDASRRASGQVDAGDGVVRMEVGEENVLSVMACESQYGTLCVCVHGPSPVRREVAAKLSSALRVTLGV